ncbi:MAG TPA: hypothetical protein VFX85_10985, partial [Solirubrobacterales bacterium]|nr:hypothetical protein [Solirubrobacterales bacterium]
MKITRPLLLALALLLLGTFAPSAAVSASLDPGFGAGGKVRTAVATTGEGPLVRGVAAQPDGSVVVATQRQLLRYRPDGQLDPRFGASGVMSLEKVEGLDFKVAALAVDGEGRIVVFGTAADPNKTYATLAYDIGYLHPSYATVLRFDPAGNPDPSFGTNGIVRSDLGQPPYLTASVFPPPQPNGQDVQINPVATVTGTLDQRGRPLLIAARFESVASVRSRLAFEGRLVARLDTSGALDQGFGAGGVLTLPGYENRGVASRADDASPLTWGYTQIRAFTESGRF